MKCLWIFSAISRSLNIGEVFVFREVERFRSVSSVGVPLSLSQEV